MNLPRSLRIGPHDIALTSTPADDEDGSYNAGAGTIAISPDLPTPIREVEVTIHEIMHALIDIYSVPVGVRKEEQVVSLLATGWAQVLRDNPWLVGWIKERVG